MADINKIELNGIVYDVKDLSLEDIIPNFTYKINMVEGNEASVTEEGSYPNLTITLNIPKGSE